VSAQRGKLQGSDPVACRRQLAVLAAGVGAQLKAERERRGLSLAALSTAAGLSVSVVQGVESGRPARLETYVRLGAPLRLKLEMEMLDPQRRMRQTARAQDPVHAAMGEIEAARLRGFGHTIGLDEPFQHFHFGGRADLVAWSTADSSFLHIENRTRFPNIQEAFGSFNAKRAYLGRDLAERAGVRRWQSEAHVMLALWSGEVLHELRLHKSSFETLCLGEQGIFERWRRGELPPVGVHSCVLVFDPIEGGRADRRRWIGLGELASARPRHRDYVDALAALREAGRA
jgi:hypothetical protein